MPDADDSGYAVRVRATDRVAPGVPFRFDIDLFPTRIEAVPNPPRDLEVEILFDGFALTGDAQLRRTVTLSQESPAPSVTFELVALADSPARPLVQDRRISWLVWAGGSLAGYGVHDINVRSIPTPIPGVGGVDR